MPLPYSTVQQNLLDSPKVWLVTGCAGFIGSNLLESLLKLDQVVVGLDNFSTGFQSNLDAVKSLISSEQWQRFNFIQGDITNLSDCETALKGVDYVLHQAALGSVPRSIELPIVTNHANITGFLNMLVAAKEEGVKSFVYAASSSTYGDHPALPKIEENIGNPLSPYAVTKYVNELYADVFAKTYDFKTIGLRYFNVFGKRQNPGGAYAAVIPKWIGALLEKETVYINGDGETSRDFCYIDNAVQANILAACAPEQAKNKVYNVACGDRTSLNELYRQINDNLVKATALTKSDPVYRDFRVGDVRHSQADISKIKQYLSYEPLYKISEGIEKTVLAYLNTDVK